MRNCDIALYGLGVMGSSLAKNMINHGFKVAAYSKSDKERDSFGLQGKEDGYIVCRDEDEMLSSLKTPRIIFLMITAGAPVDSVIQALLPKLNKGDVLIDGGNSYFKDTARRYEFLKEQGIDYLGVGVSGGEKGALYGPSMMAGGSLEGWEKSKTILQAIAAQYKGEPCCTYISRQGAGHYVKMVHNGIEYAVLELIAETYHLMKYGLCMPHEAIAECFKSWKDSRLSSYLIDISISVLGKFDEDGTPLVEKILDVGGQKGTGKWTSEEAIARGVYCPTIMEALFARFFSSDKAIREEGSSSLRADVRTMKIDAPAETLGNALLLGMILSYAQGMALIQKASDDNEWDVDMAGLTAVWRDGCIIRSELLSAVKSGLGEEKKNLVLTDTFSYIGDLEKDLRKVVCECHMAGIAIPALTSALTYYDMFRMEKMPINFVQALRDCFGAHTYQRIDKEGSFHTEWEA